MIFLKMRLKGLYRIESEALRRPLCAVPLTWPTTKHLKEENCHFGPKPKVYKPGLKIPSSLNLCSHNFSGGVILHLVPKLTLLQVVTWRVAALALNCNLLHFLFLSFFFFPKNCFYPFFQVWHEQSLFVFSFKRKQLRGDIL